MRTQVIPAQITTVEDKIAGSLNLTQILLLMIPVFWTTIVYAFFAPQVHLAWYKIPLVLVVLFLCLFLSLRIKGQVVFNWLLVLLKFNSRAKYYIFNKNDSYLRILDFPLFPKKSSALLSKTKAKRKVPSVTPIFGISEISKLERLIQNPALNLSFKTAKKGGLNVAFEQIQK
jgi:hypothetical protein